MRRIAYISIVACLCFRCGTAQRADANADKKQLGTEKNFQQYCVMNLVDKHARILKGGPTRIIMMAYRNNRDGHFSVNRFHDKLFDLGIPHVFEYHAKEAHRWDSGWLRRAVGYLFMEDFSNGPKPAGQ